MAKLPAPFEIPRELTVRGKRWLVAYDRELGDGKYDARSRMELGRGGHLRGSSYPDGYQRGPQREIHLSSFSNRDPGSACSTFLHELVHACSSQPIAIADEEKLVHDIERPLLLALDQLEWKRKGCCCGRCR